VVGLAKAGLMPHQIMARLKPLQRGPTELLQSIALTLNRLERSIDGERSQRPEIERGLEWDETYRRRAVWDLLKQSKSDHELVDAVYRYVRGTAVPEGLPEGEEALSLLAQVVVERRQFLGPLLTALKPPRFDDYA
jgi:hypothetical protein